MKNKIFTPNYLFVFLFILFGLIKPNKMMAQCTYIGAQSGISNTWSNPNNWDCGRVPTATDDVIITLAADGFIRVDGSYAVRNMTLTTGDNGALYTSNNNNVLTINGLFNFISGRITINMVIANTGTMNVTSGTTQSWHEAILTNNGIINISAKNGNDFTFRNYISMVNNGTVNINAPGIFRSNSITNTASGVFNFNAPTDQIVLKITDFNYLVSGFTNEGTLNVVQGKVFNAGDFKQNAGTWNIPTGRVFAVGNNSATVSSSAYFIYFNGGSITGGGELQALEGVPSFLRQQSL